MKHQKHHTPQFELPGTQDAFNLAGQCQHTPRTANVPQAQPQEAGDLFPEAARLSPRLRQETEHPGNRSREELTFDGEVSFEEEKQ